jgi:DNA polymerase-1
MPTSETVFLIDGTAQMYRAYHAIRNLTGPDGKSTNAVFGFVTMLRKLINDHRPELIAAAFDLRGPTFRTEIAADYKANRPPMPDDLSEQVARVHEACEALGVPVLTHEKFEADDVIGTLTKQALEKGLEVVIVTGDKDFFQLVQPHVRILNPRDQGFWYDADAVKVKFGVNPDQVVDVLALMGDAVDNVKGVPGIGEKGARELITKFGSLDTLLKQSDEVEKTRYRSALAQHAEDANVSRELVTIRTDVPVQFDHEAFRYEGPLSELCYSLFSSLGFKKLLPDYAPTAAVVEKDYEIIRTQSSLRTLVESINNAGRVGLAALTNKQPPMQAELVGLSLSLGPDHARYIPLAHRTLDTASTLSSAAVNTLIAQPLANKQISKIGHDLKHASIVLGRHNLPVEGITTDTLLVSYLLDVTGKHDLSGLALEHLGYNAIELETVIGKGTKALNLADIPIEALLDFAGEQSDLPNQLAEQLIPELKEQNLNNLYQELELPLLSVLVELERNGVQIDTNVLANQATAVQTRLDQAQIDIYSLAGESFNINSPKQLSVILFEKLGLPTLKKTGKTKTASTAVSVLEELALIHELPKKVLEWRSLQKLKGTYLDALPQLVNQKTGRIHTSFNQAVTATGRLSSSEPNLQNIPIRTKVGREIRSGFTAPPGMVLISADYSQIELRVLAHLADDEQLKTAFAQNEDIHEQTAEKVFGKDSGLDSHELRRRAKIINYALLYGKTAFTLSKDIGVTPQEAQTFIDAYFEGFPAIKTFIADTLKTGRAEGSVNTMFGRRRKIPELMSRNGQLRGRGEREAVNMPIQGTAADILKWAMIKLHSALPSDAKMILTVHDELVVETPEENAGVVSKIVRTQMEQAVEFSVPLTVDIGIGHNWKEAKG